MPLETTSVLRPPTGLDRGARLMLIRAVAPIIGQGADEAAVASVLFRTDYADPRDYLDAVRTTRGEAVAEAIAGAIDGARFDAQHPADGTLADRGDIARAAAQALLLTMPEGDFLVDVLTPILNGGDIKAGPISRQVEEIMRRRGVPYAFEGGEFQWVGDPVVEERAVRPALRALADPRLTSGPSSEYALAQAELVRDTPTTRKQAVAEACNAVESVMKVLCDEHTIKRSGKEGAQDLFTSSTRTR